MLIPYRSGSGISKPATLVASRCSTWPVTLGASQNSNSRRDDSFSTVLQAVLVDHWSMELTATRSNKSCSQDCLLSRSTRWMNQC